MAKLAIYALALVLCTTAFSAEPVQVPVGIHFHHETLRRIGGPGDNWCLTWAADGTQITSMDDGNWLKVPQGFSNRLYRILGTHVFFLREDLSGYPEFLFNVGGWFGYGVSSVDGVLYSFVSKCPENHWSGPFRGVKLLKSADNGTTWFRVDAQGNERHLAPQDEARYDASPQEMFFLEEEGRQGHGGTAYPFSFCDFVQNGRDNSAAQDEYLYVYSPEGAASNELLLARVPKQQFTERHTWEYFAGWQEQQPTWTTRLSERQPVHVFPDQNAEGHVFGWYSWLPSVVWNEGLGLYVMVNGGTYAGNGLSGSAEDYYSAWMHTKSGSLGFWYAEKPWGPWTQFFYTDEWTVDSPDNRTYQPKLSPKWISEDGTGMVLIWSDAMKDAEGRSHTVNYMWNQMEVTLRVVAE